MSESEQSRESAVIASGEGENTYTTLVSAPKEGESFLPTSRESDKPAAAALGGLDDMRERLKAADAARSTIQILIQPEKNSPRPKPPEAVSVFKGRYAITRDGRSVVVDADAGKDDMGKIQYRVHDVETGEVTVEPSPYILTAPKGISEQSPDMKAYAAQEAQYTRNRMESDRKYAAREAAKRADREDTQRLIALRGDTLGERLRHPARTFKIQAIRFSRFIRGH